MFCYSYSYSYAYSYHGQFLNTYGTQSWANKSMVLNLFDMGFLNLQPWGFFFEPSALCPHYNFVVFAPVIMKFGTVMTCDVFYAMVTKQFMTSLLLRNYDIITCTFADA